MSTKELIESKQTEIKEASKRLPLPGLVDWFFYNYWDEIADGEETMDIVYPALSAFYD